MPSANLDLVRDWHIKADDVRVLDIERALVLTRRAGQRRQRGLAISEPAANLLHVRRGKVTPLACLWDRGRALADIGLEQ